MIAIVQTFVFAPQVSISFLQFRNAGIELLGFAHQVSMSFLQFRSAGLEFLPSAPQFRAFLLQLGDTSLHRLDLASPPLFRTLNLASQLLSALVESGRSK